MDAREREASQSLRPSNKRPWEDTTLRENTNSWHGTRLPPIDAVPYRRPPIVDGPSCADGGEENSRYRRPDSRDSTPKKAKIEGSAYNNFSSWEKEKEPPLTAFPIQLSRESPVFNPAYSKSRASTLSYDLPLSSRSNFSEFAGSPGISNLCSRRMNTLQDEETSSVGIFNSCESCNRNPELAYVTQAAAAGLTQLAETLRTGRSSERRGNAPASDCPPIAQFGLKSSLSWILGKINQVDKLVEKLVRHVPPEAIESLKKEFFTDGLAAQDGIDRMKRRWLSESEETFRKGDEGLESTDSRRRSSAAGMAASDGLPPMRSQSPYQSGISSTMHPPPAPNRQLPSPPGRQLPSPTSLNFPSPRAASYSSSQSTNIPPNSGQPPSSNVLPSFSAGISSESAIQAHSAALQHEVSVQKIALSSLQGEHDKLLAAFSRSQTRASALEKKHAVSDSEIISLTEEKIRLQQQVTELERDVEVISRSRDTFRQAAVQEGAQYIEIVQKASRLEEMAGAERKAWNMLKAEMEQKIESLQSGRDKGAGPTSEVHVSIMQTAQATPPPSLETGGGIEGDLAGNPASNVEEMRKEIRGLRSRCTKAEETLRAVRADTERIVNSLSTAGNTILERVDGALKEGGAAIGDE